MKKRLLVSMQPYSKKKELVEAIHNTLESVPDFPIPNVIFYDIMPLFLKPQLIQAIVDDFAQTVAQTDATTILSPGARGFLIGPLVALKLNLKFVPVRKPNKLARPVYRTVYDSEYIDNVTVEMQKDDVLQTDKMFLIDDLLATGGVTNAMIKICQEAKVGVVGVKTIIYLKKLHAVSRVNNDNVSWIIEI